MLMFYSIYLFLMYHPLYHYYIQIYLKNILNENYEKWRNCLFTTVLGKGYFTSIKGHLCLTKGDLDKPEGQVEVKSSLIRSCFWHFWFKFFKNDFSGEGYFLTKYLIPRHFFFLKKVLASHHCMWFQGKLMNQIWENGKKL